MGLPGLPNANSVQQDSSLLPPIEEIFLQFLLLLYLVDNELTPDIWLILNLTFKRQFQGFQWGGER